MSYNPYGGKYTYGGSLKHYRTSIADGGSPNGVRKDGSRPIGQKRRGQVIGKRPDGTLIYSYGPQSAGQKDRNTQALQRAVSGQQNRSRNSEALRQRVGTKTALDSRAINNNAGVVARREQRNRINAATATNAGSRGVSSREAAQRKGSRSNANQYGNTIGNRLGRTGEAMRAKGNKAVRDANSFIQNTAKNAPEAITKAAKDTRNIFQRGASAIGDWFNERRKDLGNAGRSVGNWLSDRGRDIGRAAKSAYEAVSNSDERRALERAQQMVKSNNSAKNRAALDKAKKAYDSHLLTRLGRGAKSAADTVGDAVRNAPGNISRAASTVVGTAKRGVEAAGRAISNQDELDAYKEALAREKANPTAENKRATREARDAYNRHALTKASGAVRQAGRNVSRAVSTIGSAAAEGASKAASTATQLASSATTAVNKVITDARRMASNAVPGASDIDKLYDNYKQANQLYNDLLKTDPKVAHKIESKVEDMRKAFLAAERQFNNSTEGKIYKAISGKIK